MPSFSSHSDGSGFREFFEKAKLRSFLQERASVLVQKPSLVLVLIHQASFLIAYALLGRSGSATCHPPSFLPAARRWRSSACPHTCAQAGGCSPQCLSMVASFVARFPSVWPSNGHIKRIPISLPYPSVLFEIISPSILRFHSNACLRFSSLAE